jgi:hypothetical protein
LADWLLATRKPRLTEHWGIERYHESLPTERDAESLELR